VDAVTVLGTAARPVALTHDQQRQVVDTLFARAEAELGTWEVARLSAVQKRRVRAPIDRQVRWFRATLGVDLSERARRVRPGRVFVVTNDRMDAIAPDADGFAQASGGIVLRDDASMPFVHVVAHEVAHQLAHRSVVVGDLSDRYAALRTAAIGAADAINALAMAPTDLPADDPVRVACAHLAHTLADETRDWLTDWTEVLADAPNGLRVDETSGTGLQQYGIGLVVNEALTEMMTLECLLDTTPGGAPPEHLGAAYGPYVAFVDGLTREVAARLTARGELTSPRALRHHLYRGTIAGDPSCLDVFDGVLGRGAGALLHEVGGEEDARAFCANHGLSFDDLLQGSPTGGYLVLDGRVDTEASAPGATRVARSGRCCVFPEGRPPAATVPGASVPEDMDAGWMEVFSAGIRVSEAVRQAPPVADPATAAVRRTLAAQAAAALDALDAVRERAFGAVDGESAARLDRWTTLAPFAKPLREGPSPKR
jgi:hypothetical protein